MEHWLIFVLWGRQVVICVRVVKLEKRFVKVKVYVELL